MKNAFKTALLIAVSAGAMAACSKLIWETTFGVENFYATHGLSHAAGPTETVFLGGYTDEAGGGLGARRGLVVKFDAQGKPVWHKVLEQDEGLLSMGVQALLPDEAENVYVANILLDELNARFLLVLSKIDEQGNILWSWRGETEGSTRRELYVGNDGNLFIKSGRLLHSLTPQGDFRFTVNSPLVSGEEQNCLGWYLGGAVNPDELNVVNNELYLRVVNLDGERLADFSAQCLGFREIRQTEVMNGNVYVFGQLLDQKQAIKVIRLSENTLTLDNNVAAVLPDHSADTRVSRHGQNGFCFASLNGQSNNLSTGFIDTSLQLKWVSNRGIVSEARRPDLGNLVNANGTCSVHLIENHASDRISSVVFVDNEADGKQKAKLVTDHVAIWDISVGGRYLMQSGDKGAYATDEGMKAYLSKSLVY